MESSYVITFIGDDRPGLVEELACAVENNQGNWLESRLSQLGGKFAGLVLVSLPEDRGEALAKALESLSSTGLDVRLTLTGAPISQGECRAITLTVMGPDRPGIVKEVSHALAERQINVVDMDSHVSSAAMSAELIFQARIEAQIPVASDMDNFHDTLEEIANHMTLEIDLE